MLLFLLKLDHAINNGKLTREVTAGLVTRTRFLIMESFSIGGGGEGGGLEIVGRTMDPIPSLASLQLGPAKRFKSMPGKERRNSQAQLRKGALRQQHCHPYAMSVHRLDCDFV